MIDVTAPLLVVDRIETAPGRACADIRIAGVREHVELRMPGPEDGPYEAIISYEKLPGALSTHALAQRWVIDVLRRAYNGEHVALPVDLSGLVREASEAWPVSGQLYRNLDKSAAVSAAVLQTSHGPPGETTVSLCVHDVPTEVVVDERQDPIRFRFATGVHPWQLTPQDSYAMLDALLGATPR